MSTARLSRAALGLALVVTLPAVGRTADSPPLARVLPERLVRGPAHENWNTAQFLQADAKGRVFLLHGDDLEVDQLLPSGKIDIWRAPRSHSAAGVTTMVSDAAMSPDGGSWLLLSLSESDHLLLLSGDELRELPASRWWVSAIAYTGDGPVLAVLPASLAAGDAGASSHQEIWSKPPFLLRLQDQGWQTLAEQEPLKAPLEDSRDLRPKSSVSPQKIKGERDTRLASGRKGALWVAQQNAYVLKRYSSFGALDETVAVGGGRVQWKERSEEDWKALEKAAGMTLDRAHLLKTQPVRVVRGMTARDNHVYLLVETSQGVALDRWDDQAQALERLLLADISSGLRYLSLAAGRDGLYIASRGLGEPIWRLNWQLLEGAKWLPVPEVVVQAPSAADKASTASPH